MFVQGRFPVFPGFFFQLFRGNTDSAQYIMIETTKERSGTAAG